MPLSFCVLGSGSRGNCTVLRLGEGSGRRHVLIDAGLSRRQTKKRLAQLGVALDDITDVLLTHADRDHIDQGWVETAGRLQITWHVHRRHLSHPALAGLPVRKTEPFREAFELAPGILVQPTALPHDQLGSCGYVIEHDGVRLGFATDLGRVPQTFFDRFANLSALAIESNYDRDMQAASSRPRALKRRIMGGLGHLSNEQALEAVLATAAGSRLRHVALLHLSRQCNDPRIVRSLFAGRAPHLLDRLTITSQYRATPLLHVPRTASEPRAPALRGEQLALF